MKKLRTISLTLLFSFCLLFTIPTSADASDYSQIWDGTWNVKYYSWKTPQKVTDDSGKTFHIDTKNRKLSITYNYSGGDRKADILSVTSNTLSYRFSDIMNTTPEELEELEVFQLNMQSDGSIVSHYGSIVGAEWLEYVYKDNSGYYSIFEVGKATYTSNSISYSLDATPYISNSSTFLPLRYVAYSIGLSDDDILWDQKTKTITLSNGNVTAILQIGSKKININGLVSSLTAAPEISNGRTCLPIRAVAEAFGGEVVWDSTSKSVTIVMSESGSSSIEITSLHLSQGYLDMKVGESKSVYPIIYPASATNKTITWSSSDNSVITVDYSGKVTAVRAGEAKITAKSSNGKVAFVSVQVTNGLVQSPEFTLPQQTASSISLTASQIYAKCSPAIFYIALYDQNGNLISSGSGFFISSDGIAVTCAHVMENAYAAQIMCTDGSTYWVDSILAEDKNKDISIIKVDGNGFSYLPIGNSDSVSGGDNIYAIGSPLGLSNTISDGLVSNPARIYNGQIFIQISAPISSGSSGGALINEYGEVIGITSGAFVDGQNLNVAIPINLIYVLLSSGKI